MYGHDEQKGLLHMCTLGVCMMADLTQPSSERSCISACHSACFLLPRLLCSMAAFGQWPPQVNCPLLRTHQERAVHALQCSLSLHVISKPPDLTCQGKGVKLLVACHCNEGMIATWMCTNRRCVGHSHADYELTIAWPRRTHALFEHHACCSSRSPDMRTQNLSTLLLDTVIVFKGIANKCT